jgi:hypothetical protein
VQEGDLRAVTERFGDEGGWALQDELADGAVPGAEQVDAEVAEPIHDRVGAEVSTRERAGEEPWTVGSCAGSEVGPRDEMFPQERSKRLGNVGRVLAEGNAHA